MELKRKVDIGTYVVRTNLSSPYLISFLYLVIFPQGFYQCYRSNYKYGVWLKCWMLLLPLFYTKDWFFATTQNRREKDYFLKK